MTGFAHNSWRLAMRWRESHRADPKAVVIADRHYNRQKVGSPQFVPPGRCFVLWHERALWVTSWPFAQYVKHAWAGAWVNSLFRNERKCRACGALAPKDDYCPETNVNKHALDEGAGKSSQLIREAIAATRWTWDPPPLGIVTFVDERKTRHKRDPGRCYLKAGFSDVGYTKGGLRAFQMLPREMPRAQSPMGGTLKWTA